ncbi:hypothetical protein [Halalkalibacillus halophilus]|uniref:hypothetical protein n=1 Tax=Halalkalibacillus halophilus TaxID=392827 RepID=UPI0003FDE07C|nr:hypothetical protein [Halalkalibacillus halophilus]
MKHLIYGNGVTIQFGGRDYTNAKIIKRAINNVNTKDFPKEIYPREIKEYLLILHKEIKKVIYGIYDNLVFTNEQKESLIKFKERYNNFNSNTKVHDVGLEDYFLIHILFCNKYQINSSDRYQFKEALRVFFLDAIYNNGQIQELYKEFSLEFIEFLNNFDCIYTTNYDWNVEKVIEKDIEYIHGSFHTLSDIYNPESLRNKLPDAPTKSIDLLIEDFGHLYSDALTSYSGENKKFNIDTMKSANKGMNKFISGLKEKPELENEILEWEMAENELVRNLYHAIRIKQKENTLNFNYNKALENFGEIQGELNILGLSPFNDNHIFQAIQNNNKIKSVNYYFFTEEEKSSIRSILDNHSLKFTDVKSFWRDVC